ATGAGRGQFGRAADRERQGAAARGASVRFRRRSLRKKDTSGICGKIARRGKIRQPRRDGATDRPRRRAGARHFGLCESDGRSNEVTIDYKNTINLPQTDFAMKADLAKREPAMLAAWEKSDRYGEIQKRTAHREHAFILHDGPPYANGAIHLGHAVNKILKDIVVKSKLMAG